MPTITINNASYYYELHGKGQPLILIAGYTVDHLIWLPMLEKLSQHFQVLIFDNRGIGQTKDEAMQLTAELMADDVIAMSAALGLDKPHILGQSMGGAIAQIIAGKYPSLINKLILLTTTAKWRLAMLHAMTCQIKLIEHNIDMNIVIDNLMPWIFGEGFLSDSDSVTAFKKIMLTKPNPQPLIDQKRQFNILKAFNGLENLKNINSPTLVIHAVEDVLVLAQESEYLASRIANAHLLKISCGHAIIVEAPSILANEIIKFLQ